MPTGHRDFDLVPSTKGGPQLRISAAADEVAAGTVRGLLVAEGTLAGQITAALFPHEFDGDVPSAHIDIAGRSQAGAQNGWRNQGATAFGTRLLIDLALNFRSVAAD